MNKELISAVATITTLQELDLRDTSILDSSASQLTALKNLKRLKLDPKSVTNVSLLLLERELPDCEITPSPDSN